jgi:hypothetical protein
MYKVQSVNLWSNFDIAFTFFFFFALKRIARQ